MCTTIEHFTYNTCYHVKPIVANSLVTFTHLLDALKILDYDKAIQNLVNQIIVKLRRNQPPEQISELMDTLKTLSVQDAKDFLLQHADSLQKKFLTVGRLSSPSTKTF